MDVLQEIPPINTNFMDWQLGLRPDMHAILVDWLVDVHALFHYVPNTLYLTVSILDRYLACQQVQRPKLQLVGLAALLIAAKCEETDPYNTDAYIYVCRKAYTERQIIVMEWIILVALEFRIGLPLRNIYYHQLSAVESNDVIRALGRYILELSLACHTLTPYTAFQIASAALFVARHVVGLADMKGSMLADIEGSALAALPPTLASADPLLPTPASTDPLPPTLASADPLLPTPASTDPLPPTLASADPLPLASCINELVVMLRKPNSPVIFKKYQAPDLFCVSDLPILKTYCLPEDNDF
jgi:hypothetical protein